MKAPRSVARTLRRRRWTLLGLGVFVLVTAVLGPAGSAGARPAGGQKVLDGPNILDQIGGRFCDTDTGKTIKAVISIFSETNFCQQWQTTDTHVYCNETSLLAMVDPRIGIGTEISDAVDGDQPEQPGLDWGDAGEALGNALTPGAMKVLIDQLNGKWYELDRAKWEANESTKWYPDEATDEAVNRGNCSLLQHPPSPTCAEIKQIENDDERREKMRPGILPDDCVGTYPSANYNISYDGGWVTSIDRRIWGGMTGFVFNVGKGAVQIATWSIDQAYKMEIDDYTTLSKSISDSYKTKIVGPWRLYDFSWLILIGWVGITALRGRLGLAGGEFAAAAVFVGVAGVLLANQSLYMSEVSRVTNMASGALFQIATGTPDKDIVDTPDAENVATTALEPLRRDLHIQFVERPYEYLNWGQPLSTLPEVCALHANRITSIGATEDHGWAWQYLQQAGEEDDEDGNACQDVVNYNRNPTATRFFGALFTAIVGVTVAVTIVLMAVTVMIAKFTLAIAFAVLPFAAAAAPLPGSARRLVFLWVSVVWQAGAVVVGTANLLALLMLAMAAIFERIRQLVAEATANGEVEKISLLEYWLPIVILAGTVYVGRRRMVAATQRLSEKLADNLTRLAPAAQNWGGGGGGGVDFLAADRASGRIAGSAYRTARNTGYAAAVASTFPAVLAGRSVSQRWRERRQARRSLRNLEIMKQLDHQPHTRIVRKMNKRTGKMEVTDVEEVQTIRNERATWIPGRDQFGHHAAANDQYSREVAALRGYDIDPATGYHRDKPHGKPSGAGPGAPKPGPTKKKGPGGKPAPGGKGRPARGASGKKGGNSRKGGRSHGRPRASTRRRAGGGRRR